MLLSLLVVWTVVIPVLTVAGTYLLSGILARRAHRRPDQRSPEQAQSAPTVHLAPRRRFARVRGSRGHESSHAIR